MDEIIKAASAIISAEAKNELKSWERELMNTSKKVADALTPEPSEEEINELLKKL